MTQQLTIADFADSFGCESDQLPQSCLKLIDELDFSYRVLEGKEHDDVVLHVLKRLEKDSQIIADPSRKQVWFNGWAENLEDFIQSGNDLASLTPKFLRENQPMRWRGRYIVSSNPRFELDFITVFRTWLYHTWFEPFDTVREFGCGTGFNLVRLGELYPSKKLYGYDFVQSSVDLVNRIARSTGLNLTGGLFDMLHPAPDLTMGPRDLLFTFGALEQLGRGYTTFFDFMLTTHTGRFVHVEPTLELYDQEDLLDYLAAEFHLKRGYTSGMLPRLRELADKGVVRLEKVKRLGFGSTMMEGYTLLVWSRA